MTRMTNAAFSRIASAEVSPRRTIVSAFSRSTSPEPATTNVVRAVAPGAA